MGGPKKVRTDLGPSIIGPGLVWAGPLGYFLDGPWAAHGPWPICPGMGPVDDNSIYEPQVLIIGPADTIDYVCVLGLGLGGMTR